MVAISKRPDFHWLINTAKQYNVNDCFREINDTMPTDAICTKPHGVRGPFPSPVTLKARVHR